MIQTLDASSFKLTGGKLHIKGVNQPGMLLIHADWCGHCKTFKPVYRQLDKKLNSSGNAFPLLAIEDTYITKQLATALNFRGYPTIKFIDSNGKIIGDYEGPRELESLLSKICEVYHKCVKKN